MAFKCKNILVVESAKDFFDYRRKHKEVDWGLITDDRHALDHDEIYNLDYPVVVKLTDCSGGMAGTDFGMCCEFTNEDPIKVLHELAEECDEKSKKYERRAMRIRGFLGGIAFWSNGRWNRKK